MTASATLVLVVVVVVVVNHTTNHDTAARIGTPATAIRHETVLHIMKQMMRPEKRDPINITDSSSKAKERSGEKPPGELP
jgi:type VI protein secretion system component VasK